MARIAHLIIQRLNFDKHSLNAHNNVLKLRPQSNTVKSNLTINDKIQFATMFARR